MNTTELDISETGFAQIVVKWRDARGKIRKGYLRLAAGYSHGLLCLDYSGECIAYCTEKGTTDVSNRHHSADYAKP